MPEPSGKALVDQHFKDEVIIHGAPGGTTVRGQGHPGPALAAAPRASSVELTGN